MDYYFEIKNVVNNEYIKYPLFTENYIIENNKIYCNKGDNNLDVNIFDILPLSSFYYETIALVLDESFDCDNIIISKLKVLLYEYSQVLFIMWIGLDKKDYLFDIKYEKLKAFIKKTSEKISNGLSNNNKIDDIFLYEFENIINYLKSDYDYKVYCKKFNKFKQNINCVAIMYPISVAQRNDKNSYVSLSGTSDDYVGMNISTYKYSQSMQNNYWYVNQYLNKIFGYNFIECHLTDTTNRYVNYYSKKAYKNCKYYGSVLKNPTNLFNDYVIGYINKPNFRRHYSCCEKKIISSFNFINMDYFRLTPKNPTINNILSDYIIKVKIEPCRMCRPAILGCNDIYCNFDFFDPSIIIFNYGLKHHIELNSVKNASEPLIVK